MRSESGGRPAASKPARDGVPLGSWKRRPTLVITRALGIAWTARPSRSSLAPAPYQGAVSNSMMPASRAARTASSAASWPGSGRLPSPRSPEPGPIQMPPNMISAAASARGATESVVAICRISCRRDRRFRRVRAPTCTTYTRLRRRLAHTRAFAGCELLERRSRVTAQPVFPSFLRARLSHCLFCYKALFSHHTRLASPRRRRAGSVKHSTPGRHLAWANREVTRSS